MTNPEKPNVNEEYCHCLKYGALDRHSCQYFNYENQCTKAPVKPEMKTAQEIVDENFKGLDDLIEDVGLREWYRSLIATCIEGYAEKQAYADLQQRYDKLKKQYDLIIDWTDQNKDYWYKEAGLSPTTDKAEK